MINLPKIFGAGESLGALARESLTAAAMGTDEDRLLNKAYRAVQDIDPQVAGEILEAKSKLARKSQPGQNIDRPDVESMVQNASIWRRLVLRDLESRLAFDSAKPITLNVDAIVRAANYDDNPLFDPRVWYGLPEIARNDLGEAARCLLAEAWTAAAMTSLRGTESVVRQYYEFKTNSKAEEKNWGSLMMDLEKRDDVNKTLIGNLHFIRERRNETQHPDTHYDQRASEEVLMTVVGTINAMSKEMKGLPQKKP